MQGQSVKHSWWESWANIFVGFAINFSANMLILPLFGFTGLTIHNNIIIGLIYTVISLVRSFVLRRAFNRLHIWQYRKDQAEEVLLGEEAAVILPAQTEYKPE